MRITRVLTTAIALLAVGSGAAIAQPGNKSAQTKAAAKVVLPPAIETAFKAAYPKATIKNVLKEKLNGKDVYEVESIDAGKTRDIIYRPDGVIALLEEGITVAEVPPAVMAAIAKSFPKATVTRYEKVIQDGVVFYEVQLKGARASEAKFMPDGSPKK